MAFTTIFSCNKSIESKVNDPIAEKEFHFNANNLSISYSGKVINDSLNFTISIKDISSNKSIEESFVAGTDRTTLGKSIADQITAKQAILKNKFDLAEIKKLVTTMDDMVNFVTRNMKIEELKSLSTQGLFMSNSLIKSVHRRIVSSAFSASTAGNPIVGTTAQSDSNNTATSNSVYEGFNRELSSYTLEEDLVVNVAYLKNYINSNTAYAQEKGFLFVRDILNTYSQTSVTVYKLEEDIINYTANNPNKFEGTVSSRGFAWPIGSSHGCCGNYSGPCMFWHPVCHLHDALCSNCSPRWFCLSGCIPD